MSKPAFSSDRPLRIGTRGSPLALAQAHETRDRLMAAHGLGEESFRIEVISTTGDRVQDKALRALGGKGLFTKEIEAALLEREIDIAVHSMKDVPTERQDGLALTCLLPREDVRDAFVSHRFSSIDELPEGATVGTSSIRRRAQLLARRPDLVTVEFRGNVQTRLRKLTEGVAEATFLAVAGLHRLGMEGQIPATPIDPTEMLPAIAQGAIGIEQREDDAAVCDLVAAIDDRETGIRLAAERSFLAKLDGSCQTPIAGLATLSGDTISFTGQVIRPDGSEILTHSVSGPSANAAELGNKAALVIISRAGQDFFSE